MRNSFWKHFTLFIAITASVSEAFAIPAPRRPTTVAQPNGNVIHVWLRGDEHFHYALSTDGYVLLPDQKGFYTYASYDSTGALRAGTVIAHNVAERGETDKIFLKTIKPGLTFSDVQLQAAGNRRLQRVLSKQAALRSSKSIPTGLISNYPTKGSPKSLVILVNFSDLSFNAANSTAEFSNMLNEAGYSEGYHVGSTRDYYSYNSSGVFTPEFVVVGPVTVSHPMAYYGKNDSNGDDSNPAEMVSEACQLAAKSVDFSDFDYDNDGYVDNVYIYYAGMGEADGGSANTIWPHSWSLSSADLSLTLNGKIVDAYSCSAELDGTGSRSGIGTFTHEYGHILGLTDMYDVDYNTYNGLGFDLGEWSLMADGAYNGNGCVPPCLTILERKLLGWATPTVLTGSASLSLSDLGSTNQGYMIATSDSGEYYLLENRQQNINKWDQYILGHGMLIYHVDMRSDASISLSYYGTPVVMTFADMWTYNVVNAVKSHQCADIEEADNTKTYYTSGNSAAYILGVKGDPFPGTSYNTSFTDTSTPSMATWDGSLPDKPITSIKESNGIITFDFRGGTFDKSPTVLPASGTGNYKFTANWDSLSRATAYYLDVFTKNVSASGDTVTTYLPGYESLVVQDTSYTINNVDDNTTYYYQLRATNSYVTTGNSGTIKVTTPKATQITSYVKDKTIYLKGMDHGATVKIYDTMGILRYTANENYIAVNNPGVYIVETEFDGKRVIIKIAVP